MKYLKIPAGADGIPKTTANMKAKFIGEFSFSKTMIDESDNEIEVPMIIPWVTCKEIFKEMVVFAAAKENESSPAQDGEGRATPDTNTIEHAGGETTTFTRRL